VGAAHRHQIGLVFDDGIGLRLSSEGAEKSLMRVVSIRTIGNLKLQRKNKNTRLYSKSFFLTVLLDNGTRNACWYLLSLQKYYDG
jgi:hypothetical protein